MTRINGYVPIAQRVDLKHSSEVQDAIAAAEDELAESGRVLLRPSGTEPLIRVMVEGQDEDQVAALAARLAQTVTDVAKA